VKWSPRFSTGVEQIDQQHRMLFQMSEDYRHTLDAGEGASVYQFMLESLDDYARGHFGVEEECMFRHHCPAAETNSLAHGQFLKTIGEFQQRFAARGFDRADALRLVDYIDKWLTNHIARIDTQLKGCLDDATDV
jgi:hemerythrin-like metal-binding protein